MAKMKRVQHHLPSDLIAAVRRKMAELGIPTFADAIRVALRRWLGWDAPKEPAR